VSHIAQLADTDLSLTRKAVQHLVYYGCLIILDVFSFGAVYAPTSELTWFVTDTSVQEECARYVRVPQIRFGRSGKMGSGSERSKSRDERSSTSSQASQHSNASITSSSTANSNATPNIALNAPTAFDTSLPDDATISPETLISLYASLRQGLPLKTWTLENLPLLHGIDIRRFITFGVIKGIIYRVHKYAIATSTFTSPTSHSPTEVPRSTQDSIHGDADQSTVRDTRIPPHHTQQQSRHLSHKHSLASTANLFTTPEGGTRLESLVDGNEHGGGLPLIKFLDGMHCFDEICTELGMGEQVVEKKVKGAGEVVIVYR
jgi:hypothetical protein